MDFILKLSALLSWEWSGDTDCIECCDLFNSVFYASGELVTLSIKLERTMSKSVRNV